MIDVRVPSARADPASGTLLLEERAASSTAAADVLLLPTGRDPPAAVAGDHRRLACCWWWPGLLMGIDPTRLTRPRSDSPTGRWRALRATGHDVDMSAGWGDGPSVTAAEKVDGGSRRPGSPGSCDGLHQTDDAEVVAVGARARPSGAEAFADRFGIAAPPRLLRGAGRRSRRRRGLRRPRPHSRHAPTPCCTSRRASTCCARSRSRSTQRRPRGWSTRPGRRLLPHGGDLEPLPARLRRLLGELLAAGRIGEPLIVEADFGFAARSIRPTACSTRRSAAAALLDLGIYPVQLVHLVLGPARRGRGGRAHSAPTGVDEQVAAVLHHDGGAAGGGEGGDPHVDGVHRPDHRHRGVDRAARVHALPGVAHACGPRRRRVGSRRPSRARACASRSPRSTAASPRA